MKFDTLAVAFAALEPVIPINVKTKICVQLTTGGRIWLDNCPNFQVELELLKHKIGRSSMAFFERVQVPAR